MQLSDPKTRINELISLGESVRDTAECKDDDKNYPVGMAAFYQFRTASLSFLRNVFGNSHPYYRELDRVTVENRIPSTLKALGVLQAAKSDLDGGWLRTTKSLAAADVLANFLDMAHHLLDAGYKDPAAVVLGSVLEEHLRNLCTKHKLDTTYEKNGKDLPKKADTMNADLAKVPAYNKLDQKNVTAWLDLRNQAAHGKYSEYTADQVSLLHNALLDFLTRNPA